MDMQELPVSQTFFIEGHIKSKPTKTLSPGEVERVALKRPLDVAVVRTTVRKLADELGYSLIDQVRLSTAVFEIADNIVSYAGQGEIVILWKENTQHRGLQFFCHDQGVHDAQLTHLLEPQRNQTRKIVDEFQVSEDVEHGNCVTMAVWLE